MDVEEHKTIVRTFLGAIGQARWNDAASLMTDDATWWNGGSDQYSGRMEKGPWLASMEDLFKQADGPMRLEIGDVTAEDDRVAVEAKSHATFRRGTIIYENEYHFLFYFRNGKIYMGKDYSDCQKGPRLLAELSRSPQ